MEFLPIIIIMGIMYFALIMPQQRRAKAHRLMMSQLEEGDEVLTASGIYGIKISKSSISERVVYADADAVSD